MVKKKSMQISRSEQKRRIRQVEELVREFVALPAPDLASLPLDKEIRELLRQTGTLKGGARKRQIKYLTKRLRQREELDDLYAWLTRKRGRSLEQKRVLHELEYLRDTLVAEYIERYRSLQDEGEELLETWQGQVLADIKKRFPSIDILSVGRLAVLYARTRNRRHSREIFRLLRAASDQERFEAKKNG